jgi:hypothetical protein
MNRASFLILGIVVACSASVPEAKDASHDSVGSDGLVDESSGADASTSRDAATDVLDERPRLTGRFREVSVEYGGMCPSSGPPRCDTRIVVSIASGSIAISQGGAEWKSRSLAPNDLNEVGKWTEQDDLRRLLVDQQSHCPISFDFEVLIGAKTDVAEALDKTAGGCILVARRAMVSHPYRDVYEGFRALAERTFPMGQ